MADLNIQINFPVLIANQGFKVEYREQGDPTWILWGVEDNDAFSITGLSEGVTYEVQYTFLSSLSPQVACDPVVKVYYIPAEIPCVTASADITQVGDLWELAIRVTYPSPYTAPCGGFEVEYGTAAPYTVVPYTTLPYPIIFPASNDAYYVAIYSLDCNGNRIKCWEDVIEPSSSPCTHATINSAYIYTANGLWYLSLTITPSSPLSTTYDIVFSQTNTVTSGIPDAGTVTQVNSTGTNPETFIIQINPNPNINFTNGQYIIKYQGAISDRCDYSSPFTAEYTRED